MFLHSFGKLLQYHSLSTPIGEGLVKTINLKRIKIVCTNFTNMFLKSMRIPLLGDQKDPLNLLGVFKMETSAI